MFEMAISGPALLLILGLSYAVGAIPFGLILARLMGLGDLRSIGSGILGQPMCCARAINAPRR